MELKQLMPEVRAAIKALQVLEAELIVLLDKQAVDKISPCPVCGYLRMKGELVEPSPKKESSAISSCLGGHWKVVRVGEAEEVWEIAWVEDPETTSKPQRWRNPWDVTYTVTRGDDA